MHERRAVAGDAASVERIAGNGKPATGTLLFSVVLCTTATRPSLEACLDSLERLDDPWFEVIVVENGPRARLSAVDLAARGMRHVHEPRKGLDVARNRGMQEALGAVVAYIDDDCIADRNWLGGLRRAFADASVTLVCGRVVPATVERDTHRWFEERYTFDRGPIHKDYDVSAVHHNSFPYFPYNVGAVGAGCNMAVRRSSLEAVGGFDVALDMGSLIGGGGDLDAMARVAQLGGTVRYAADALVLHAHRDDMRELRWQFWGYGLSQGALVWKWFLTHQGSRRLAARFFVARLAEQRMRLARRIRGANDFPRSLLLIETAGMILGPGAYHLSWIQARVRRRRSR